MFMQSHPDMYGPGDAPPPNNASHAFNWRTIALYSAAVIFLGIVLWRSRVWEAGDSLSNTSFALLIAVPLLTLLLVIPLGLRQRLVLRSLGYRFGAIPLSPVAFYGNTVGFMTPASSGEILRPALLNRAFGLPLSRGMSAVLFERLYSMGLFSLTGLLAFTLTGVLPAWLAAPAILLLTVGMLGPLIMVRLFNIPVSRLPQVLPGFVQRRLVGLEEAGEAFERLWRDPALAVRFVILTLITFGVLLLQFWLVADGTGGEIAPHEAWVVLVASAMAGMISGLPFGLGAGDVVMVSLLTAYGLDAPDAAAAVILVRLLINLPTGLMGLGAYLITLRQAAPAQSMSPTVQSRNKLATVMGGSEE
jgi:uncharacterized protein (TIRG00374 family)